MVRINFTGIFKYVINDTNKNQYTQYSNVTEGLAGHLDSDIFRDILDINMFHLARMLDIEDICITKEQLDAKVKHLFVSLKSKVNVEGDYKVMNISVKKLIFENEPLIFDSIGNLDFSHFVQTIKDNADHGQLEKLHKIGAQLRTSFAIENWNECLGIIMGVNTICLHTCMFVVCTIFNLMYLCFTEFTKDVRNFPPIFDTRPFTIVHSDERDAVEMPISYHTAKDVIVERVLSTAIQQFLLDHSRDFIHLKSVVRKSKSLDFVLARKTLKEAESALFNFMAERKSVYSLFTTLTLSSKQWPKYMTDAGKIYNKWGASAPEQKLVIFLDCQLNEDEEKDLFPHALTIFCPEHSRTIEYIRFAVNQLMAEKDTTLKEFIKTIFSDMNALFDHCLFPDRQNIMAISGGAEEMINTNQFEVGQYSLRQIIDKLMTVDKGTIQYLTERFQHLLNRKSVKKLLIKTN